MNRFPDFQIPSTVKYLSKVIDDLPDNCIYNKILTGAGATSIALENSHNYVICVPFVSLIENKMAQIPNLFGMYEQVKIKDLKSYLNDPTIPVKKIMVTYDSIEKILPYIDPKEYKIMIDEVHILCSQYSFRNEAVKKVLKNYTKFKSFCFVTATMTNPDFLLTELESIPIYEASWEVVKEVNVVSAHCESDVIHTVAFLVDNFINGVEEGNAHIFVNSVEFIKQVIKNCNLTDENCKAIWSKHNKIPMPFERGKTTENPKKINFYTSTCFEGCDIYDTDGKIYIVSDGNKSHTLIDISTSFQQIAGRIRKSKYIGTITHIYSTTRYSNTMTYEEYKKFVEAEIKSCNRKVKELNTLSNETRTDIAKLYRKEQKQATSSYISVDDTKFNFDENLVKIDLYNFKVTKCLYKIKVNLSEEYEVNGLRVTEIAGEYVNKVIPINPKENFKDTVIELEKGDSDFALWAYKQYNFLHDAILYLGYERIKELNYSITNIKRHINNKKFFTTHDKIKAELKLNYKIANGTFFTLPDMKKIIQEAHDNLKYPVKAKANDIEKYFNVSKASLVVDDKRTKGYTLINVN